MLITLYKIGGVHFRLHGFHVKAKNERFTAASSRCRQNLKINMKISGCRLADYVKTLQQKACRTCSTIIFLHSTNQIIDLWRFRWRCSREILNSRSNRKQRRHELKPETPQHPNTGTSRGTPRNTKNDKHWNINQTVFRNVPVFKCSGVLGYLQVRDYDCAD